MTHAQDVTHALQTLSDIFMHGMPLHEVELTNDGIGWSNTGIVEEDMNLEVKRSQIRMLWNWRNNPVCVYYRDTKGRNLPYPISQF